MSKREDIIAFYTTILYPQYDHKYNSKHEYLNNLVNDNVSFYQEYCIYFTGENLPRFSEVHDKFCFNINRIFNAYDPVVLIGDDLGMVEVNVLNKKLELSGKRAKVKLGKFLSRFPMLTDASKESIVNHVKATFETTEGLEFKLQDYSIEKVVQMTHAKSSSEYTVGKLLDNSCMRYSCDHLCLSEHPYAVYNSGDFWIAYLTKDDKLYGRALVHKKSGTYSSIYINSSSSYFAMETKLHENGFRKVDCEGREWAGAKLLSIETWYDDGDDSFGATLAPYLDYWEFDYGWDDGEYIHLFTERPSYEYSRVNLQCADGYYVE